MSARSATMRFAVAATALGAGVLLSAFFLHRRKKKEEPRLPPRILLMDIGSSCPSSTLALRQLAAGVTDEMLGEPAPLVEPISLMQADKIDPRDIEGVPAVLLKQVLHHHAKGQRLVIQPLFFGPSMALTKTVPRTIVGHESDVTIGEHLLDCDSSIRNIASLLCDDVEAAASDNGIDLLSAFPVVLVDHGSPQRNVEELRRKVANAMSTEFFDRSLPCVVTFASMERKPGDEYSFCDPLLETELHRIASTSDSLILAHLFFLPGTHGGPGGDIDQICARVSKVRHHFALFCLEFQKIVIRRFLSTKFF